MARIEEMTAEEIAAHPDLETVARDLARPVNAERLAAPRFIAAVVRALAARAGFDAALALTALHAKAFRGEPAIEVLEAALEASLASGTRAHLEQSLGSYEKILRRDPSDLYLVGRMHADAFECAARLGESERGFLLLERLLDHYAPGRVGRTLPDDFPIDDARIAELWLRPAQSTLLKALEAERKKRAKKVRRS